MLLPYLHTASPSRGPSPLPTVGAQQRCPPLSLGTGALNDDEAIADPWGWHRIVRHTAPRSIDPGNAGVDSGQSTTATGETDSKEGVEWTSISIGPFAMDVDPAGKQMASCRRVVKGPVGTTTQQEQPCEAEDNEEALMAMRGSVTSSDFAAAARAIPGARDSTERPRRTLLAMAAQRSDRGKRKAEPAHQDSELDDRTHSRPGCYVEPALVPEAHPALGTTQSCQLLFAVVGSCRWQPCFRARVVTVFTWPASTGICALRTPIKQFLSTLRRESFVAHCVVDLGTV